jgi:hypothetical protein
VNRFVDLNGRILLPQSTSAAPGRRIFRLESNPCFAERVCLLAHDDRPPSGKLFVDAKHAHRCTENR